MLNKILTLIILTFTLSFFSQNNTKKFEGILVYSITPTDSSLQRQYETKYMIIHTNDTIVRTENNTLNLGKQVVLKHLQLNKSYLLLENNNQKFAIQTDHNNKNDSIQTTNENYKKCRGNRKICNQKAKKLLVTNTTNNKTLEVYYFKKISSKYIEAYKKSPGLPVLYYLESNEGLIKYELIEITPKKINRNIFGIPSDYQKIGFNEFIKLIHSNPQQ